MKQEKDFIVFHDNLQQLMEKVEMGEIIPKLQASHSPMCKFFTAYYVISEIRRVPLEPIACTSLDESHVIYGVWENS